MPRLKSANFAVTELATGIDASANSLVVADASLFPDEGPFMILVHDSTPGFAGVREFMEVGSIDKNTDTFSGILRGRENTFPVAHNASARIECVWTAGTHAELEDTDNKGKAGGYASLDTTGNVPSDQLGNIEIPDMEAENVEYDNAESELDAENVQDAIDEVNADLVSHKADKASPTKLGHVKVGQGLEIDSEGVLSVNAEGVPTGLISMWSGTNIPGGWALCDGQNGTPDLRDRFIVGAGGDYSVGDTGGEAEVTLTTAQLPSHSHGSGSLSTGSAGSHSHGSGTLSTSVTGSHNHSYTMPSPTSIAANSGDKFSFTPVTKRESASTSSAGSHSHSISGSTSSAGSHSHSISGTTSSAGSGQVHENRPPYFALAFIMKL